MNDLTPNATALRTAHAPGAIDGAAIGAHGIGRGDFAALVFSGDVDAIGEVAGYSTWSTARKFAVPDPRISLDRCLARRRGSPLPLWPADRVRPTPGVCFVFADDAHPALDTLRAGDGVEYEHFVVLSRLTGPAMTARRVARFIGAAGSGPIAMLGYGDQGTRLAFAMIERAVEHGRIHVVDDRAERQEAAANVGLRVVAATDPVLSIAAIVCSPLTRPTAFGGIVQRARREARAVLDNALPWDDRPELRARGNIQLTGCAERALTVRGDSIEPADHGLELTLAIIRDCDLRVGTATVRSLRSGGRCSIGARSGEQPVKPTEARTADPLAHLVEGRHRAFVHLEGQSNHHDAAFAIFAARGFLSTFFPDAVAALLPGEHRGAFGATPFERLVPRTITGRSLGSPFMTPCEQTAIGVLARHFCGAGHHAHPLVEIGSALGGSALLMAAATGRASPADGPPIVSIDPDAPTRAAMRAVFECEGVAGRLSQIIKTSDAAIADLSHLTGKVGLVLIDGLHTRDCSVADFTSYAQLVRRGGCIAFHDCDLRHAGVFRTVAEVAACDPRFTLRCMVDAIAVLERVG